MFLLFSVPFDYNKYFPSLQGTIHYNIFSVSKSLAEFAARRRQRNKIIFSRDMCVRKNTARAASVLHSEVCHAGKTWWKSGKGAGVAGDTREQNNKNLVANVTDLQENCCKCALMGLHCRKPVYRRIATKRRP
jgi:hypothetical protein